MENHYKLYIASWCRPSKKLQTHIAALGATTEFDPSTIEVIDIDTPEGNVKAQKFDIRGTPTLVKYQTERNTLDSVHVGYRTEEQLASIFYIKI